MEETQFTIIGKKEFEHLVEILHEISSKFPQRIQDSNERLNQRDAAKYLNVTQQTLINWKKKGLVPYEQLPGSSKITYYKDQLKQAIRQNSKLLQPSRK